MYSAWVVGNVEHLEMIYIVSGFLPRALIRNKQDHSACCLTAAATETVTLMVYPGWAYVL